MSHQFKLMSDHIGQSLRIKFLRLYILLFKNVIKRRSSMKAIWKGQVVAESEDTVMVEGNHYFPESSLERNYIQPSDKTSSCSWKGVANYYSLVVNGETNKDAVWFYPAPKPAVAEISGRVAFWHGVQVVE
jgi:uncharacterized protein (DUF427 family)